MSGPETVIQGEGSQKEKDKHRILTCICRSWKKGICEAEIETTYGYQRGSGGWDESGDGLMCILMGVLIRFTCV